MADRVRVSDLDFVYISFKEPNKEENWADLKNKVPWAKRVDGVVGFDSAHKAAAELAETDFFISVDGDNVIDERFLLETLDWTKTDRKAVHRWRARNNVNGLVYGNGGLVGWPKETCLAMKTHEHADNDENKLDFCWGVPHENLHNCYSETIINADKHQAFTAGYREGVKMSLNKGQPIDAANFMKDVWPQNLKVLLTWMNVGADVEYGNFAMLGARMGCYQTVLETQARHINISDLDGMREVLLNYLDEDNIDADLQTYGESLKQRLDVPIANYSKEDSRFFKFVMPQHINTGVQDREYK
jgi:hypothetical protein